MKLQRGWRWLAGLCLCACAAWGGERRELRLYTWSDYFDPDVVADFEKEHNCRVIIDYFDSNEAMYAKLRAGAKGYDLLTPSSYMVSVMAKQGMLQDFDLAKVPNAKGVDPDYLKLTSDPTMRTSIPYTRTVTGVGYNTRRVKDPGTSWAVFGQKAFAGRMTMLNDMREALGAALKHLGHSLNTVDDGEIAAARDLLVQWKRNLAKFEVDEAKRGLGAGEFWVVQQYNGDVAMVKEEAEHIDFFVPVEGSSISSDDFVIPAWSLNADLAMAFVDHMIEPKNAARNMDTVCYYMPIPDAIGFVREDLRESHVFNIPKALLEKCEVILDLGEGNRKYTQAWDAVKAAE